MPRLTRNLVWGLGLVCTLTFTGCWGEDENIESVQPGERVEEQPVANIPTDEWRSWRGPNNNGIAPSKEAPLEWNSSQNVVWKTEIPGHGHASPTIVGDRIFLATADDSAETQSVLCLNRTNGEILWQKELHKENFPAQGDMHRKSSHATSTIAAADDRLFAAFLNGDAIWVTALDFDGEKIWQVKVGGFSPKFGYAPSPILYQDSVILAADHRNGGFLAALEQSNGDVIWKTNRPEASSYASPVVANVAGKDQLLISGCGKVSSYNPTTGDLNWDVKGTTEATVGTMVWEDDRVYAGAGYPGKEVICVQADGSNKVLWKDNVKFYVPSLVINQGYLYGINDDGIAYCWDAKTGELRWRVRVGGNFSSSPVLVYDKIYVTDESGKTLIFKANPNEFEKLAENQLGEETFASPVVVNGQLYLRVADRRSGSRQETLYCIGE